MSDMIWVASKDGKGWASNRTRDILDVAFTVYRETDTKHAVVEVRVPWYDDPKARARRVLARFAFDDHRSAKAFIELTCKSLVSTETVQSTARTNLVEQLMQVSNQSSSKAPVGYDGTLWGYLDGVFISKETFDAKSVPAVATPSEPDETVSKSTPWISLSIDRSADAPVHVAVVTSAMMESIAEVQETVEPAFDPSTWKKGDTVPAGYINLGGTLTKIGWPS